MKSIYFVLVIIFGILFNNPKSVSLTAKQGQLPCEPHCCKVVYNQVIYFCFLTDLKCNFSCYVKCRDPETGTFLDYQCHNGFVERENVCMQHPNIRGINGCDFPEIGETANEMASEANGICFGSPSCNDMFYSGTCTSLFSLIGNCWYALSTRR